MQDNIIIYNESGQVENNGNGNVSNKELHDIAPNGKERPWNDKKIRTNKISDTYDYLGFIDKGQMKKWNNRRDDLYQCSTYLEFWRNPIDGEKKLYKANFCKKRLCPMCSWRRSLKIFGQVSKVMEYLKEKEPKAHYIFITLTVENVTAAELDNTLRAMSKAFPQLWRSGKLAKTFLGAYRGIEITYSKKYDTFHPHIHAILMVKSHYFSSSAYYVSQKELCDLWGKKLKLSYTPICDIRKVKGDTGKAVAEIAKYSVKDDDIINSNDLDLSANVLKTLDIALKGKRLVSFYGKMKEAHNLLNLQNIEDDEADLVDTEISFEDKMINDGWIRETYAFNVGIMRYQRS